MPPYDDYPTRAEAASPHAPCLKVSYCTTCGTRLAHLRTTLPANLAAEAGNANVEFVVLDYGGQEGAAAWVKANFRSEIESGLIRVALYPDAKHFSAEHAKNMASRLATGDILCNVDADNIVARDFSRWLVAVFRANPEAFVTTWSPTIAGNIYEKTLGRLRGQRRAIRDMGGRIAISRANFERLGGYDEALVHGWDDVNFAVGARRAGLTIVRLPERYYGSAITHGDEFRMDFMSRASQEMLTIRQRRSRVARIAEGVHVLLGRAAVAVNDGNVGCGAVLLNFEDAPRVIAPFPVLADARPAPGTAKSGPARGS